MRHPPERVGITVLIWLVTVIGMVFVVVAVANRAHAGSPAYCRPYSALAAERLMQWVWLRLYSSCLNVEGPDPVVPLTAAGVLATVVPEAIESIGIVPASGPPGEPPTPTRPVDVTVMPEASDAPDAARVAKCRRLFPASFDAKSMTGLLPHHRKRSPCP